MGAAPQAPCPAPIQQTQQEIVDVVRQVNTVRYQDVPTPYTVVREVCCTQYQNIPVVQCQNVTVPYTVTRPVSVPVPQVVTKV